MSNHQEVVDLAKTLTGNDNLYSVQPFIKIAGETLLGLFLERVVYWSDKSGNENLRQLKIFYKSAEEWEDELGLSYAQVTRARKELESMGFIKTNKRKVNGAPTLHYYANMGAIKEAVIQYYEGDKIDGYANLEKSEIQQIPISENGKVEIQESPETIEIQETQLSSYNSSNSNDNSTKERAASRPPDMIPVEKIFVEETKKHCLNKAQIEVIQETVGLDPPALERWRESVRAWNLNGNKPTDAAGMLDWFKTGKRSNYDPKKNGAHKNGQPTKQPTDHRPDFEKRDGQGYTPEEWAKLSRGESLARP